MKPHPCPDCGSQIPRAIGVQAGREPITLRAEIYVVFQCAGCGEVFMDILK